MTLEEYEKHLLAKGYQEYPVPRAPIKGHLANSAFSKIIWGGNKKLYFIHVAVYEFNLLGFAAQVASSFEAHIYLDEDKRVDFELGRGWDVASVEAFLAKQYETLPGIPDVHNND